MKDNSEQAYRDPVTYDFHILYDYDPDKIARYNIHKYEIKFAQEDFEQYTRLHDDPPNFDLLLDYILWCRKNPGKNINNTDEFEIRNRKSN